MSDLGLDPITLTGLLQGLPAIQQQQRRVEQLRAMQQQSQALANTPGTGNYTPTTQQGGLFPTVQQYQPDYAKAGNQIAGTMGAYLGQQQANTAQDQLDQTRNAAVLNAVQQASGGGGAATGGGGNAPPTSGNPLDSQAPSNATIRAYLSLIAGPEMKDIIGVIPHVSKMYVGEDGYEHKVMSDGTEITSKTKSSLPMGTVTDGQGNVIQFGKVTGDLGSHYLASPNVSPGQGTNAPAAPTPTGTVPTPPGLPNGLPDETNNYVPSVYARLGGAAATNPDGTASTALINAIKGQESSNNPNAVSPKGAIGLMGIMPKTGTDYNAGDLTDPVENTRVGTAHINAMLRQFNGNVSQALAAYNSGATTVQNALQPSGTQTAPATAPAAGVATAPTGGIAGSTPNPTGAGSIVHVATPAQKMAAATQARLDVEAQNMPRTMANAATAKGMAEQVGDRAKLADALPGMTNSLNNYIGQINGLLNDPHLKDISGGQTPSLLADEHVIPGAAMLNNFALKGDPRLTTARNLQQVMAGSVLQNVQQNRALFQRVTNKDVGLLEASANRLGFPIAYKDNVTELNRLKNVAQQMLDTSSAVSKEQVQPMNVQGQTVAPNAAPPAAAPAAGPINVQDLVKLYGGR